LTKDSKSMERERAYIYIAYIKFQGKKEYSQSFPEDEEFAFTRKFPFYLSFLTKEMKDCYFCCDM
jgi:hypothetical protein